MMTCRLFVVVFALLALPAARLAAQDKPDAAPRVELGLNGALLGGYMDVSDLRDDLQFGFRGFGPNLRINLSERFAFEAGATAGRVDAVRLVTYEFSLVLNRSAHPRGGMGRFIRIGAGGRDEMDHVKEVLQKNQDHSVTSWPAYDHHKLTVPNFLVVGAGFQHALSRHVALTTEVDGVVGAVGFGMKLSAGIVVPIGSYGAR